MDDGIMRRGMILAGLMLGLCALSLPGLAALDSGDPSKGKSPKIVRVVCTDHICGNCDGRCHRKSGHVAVDKRGHCACTPTEGSPLDIATRDAYADDTPK